MEIAYLIWNEFPIIKYEIEFEFRNETWTNNETKPVIFFDCDKYDEILDEHKKLSISYSISNKPDLIQIHNKLYKIDSINIKYNIVMFYCHKI